MKTSNILIASFVALSVIGTAIVAQVAINRYKDAIKASSNSKTSLSGMTVQSFPSCQSLVVFGNNALDVQVRTSSSDSSSVWVDGSLKNKVMVAHSGGVLTLTSRVSDVSKSIKVVVALPKLQQLVLANAVCTVDSVVADKLTVSSGGNSTLVMRTGEVKTLSYTGNNNTTAVVDNSLLVGAWIIRLSDNANLSGVSPNGKLDMKVTDNANINLNGGRR